MLDTPKELNLPDSCTIFVGGEPIELVDLELTDIGGSPYVKFTRPDGVEDGVMLNPSLTGTFADIHWGIAVSVGGFTSDRWEQFSEEEKEACRRKEAKLRSTVKEEVLHIFRGFRS